MASIVSRSGAAGRRGASSVRDFRRHFAATGVAAEAAMDFILSTQREVRRKRLWQEAAQKGLPTDSPNLSRFRKAAWEALRQERAKQQAAHESPGADGKSPASVRSQVSNVSHSPAAERRFSSPASIGSFGGSKGSMTGVSPRRGSQSGASPAPASSRRSVDHLGGSRSDLCPDQVIEAEGWRAELALRRAEVYLLFEMPSESPWPRLGRLLSSVSLLFITLSTFAFIFETMPELSSHDLAWKNIEITVVSFFTAEYVIRAVCAPGLYHFYSVLNLVDLLAIAPFYLSLFYDAAADVDLRVLRVIRLMRVFRVFKMSKHSVHFQLIVETVLRAKDALLVLVFILCIAIIIFGGAIYFLEESKYNPRYYQDRNDWIVESHINTDKTARNPFESIPASCWWAIVTMTTVGYGDATPVSTGGKLVASFCMLIGILVVALPVTIVGSAFSDVYRNHVGKLESATAERAIDPRLRDAGVIDVVEQLATKRQVLLRIFLECERCVGEWRFQGRKFTHRPWTLPEEALLNSVILNIVTLENFLIRSSCKRITEVEDVGLLTSLFLRAKKLFSSKVAPRETTDMSDAASIRSLARSDTAPILQSWGRGVTKSRSSFGRRKRQHSANTDSVGEDLGEGLNLSPHGGDTGGRFGPLDRIGEIGPVANLVPLPEQPPGELTDTDTGSIPAGLIPLPGHNLHVTSAFSTVGRQPPSPPMPKRPALPGVRLKPLPPQKHSVEL